MQKITTCLWFDGQAEEAAAFYTSVFDRSRITGTQYATDAVPGGRAGAVLTVSFEVEGHPIMALNGGPEFHFSEAVSLIVHCDSQEEVDRYWAALTADGGAESECGWLKDKYGMSWQITPRRLIELISSPDRALADRVFRAMLTMRKLDIQRLEDAAKEG
ncbi:VOC family protein [Streptomyces sp. LP05-1]|uniref:VOC family protein n=1 Tax=Streptomyces pyxinae TaxID=2970734 RepID=A0ABT2CI08_9ACTN|nr:VOC family protein [Streptomyces sp. LP05-1]MCS0636945.1 VOC family protein [Streptomyces sp. LP05-1]